MPQYPHIFDWDTICMHIEDGLNVDELVAETKYAIDGLENSGVEELSSNEYEYESGYVAERHDLPTLDGNGGNRGLRDMLKYASNLSDYSRELRLLTEQHNITQLATLIGVSIVKGNSHQFSDENIHRRCMELMAYFDPLLVDNMKQVQIRKERKSTIREGNTDWFEAADRWR